MKKYTQSELKNLVSLGAAVDVTLAFDYDAIPERYEKIGYSGGINGCTGLLLRGESGKLYAVTRRSTALFLFG